MGDNAKSKLSLGICGESETDFGIKSVDKDIRGGEISINREQYYI